MIELREFSEFVERCLRQQNGCGDLTLDECLHTFREYREQLDHLRAALKPALDRADRGERQEIDFEDLKRRGRERLNLAG